jgi:hypothetical protein
MAKLVGTTTRSATLYQALTAPDKMKLGAKGAPVYTEEGVEDSRLTLFTMLVRGLDTEYIAESVSRILAFAETNTLAKEDLFVMMMQTRDIRGGKGERELFYTLFMTLMMTNQAECIALLDLIPEYGCWGDLITLFQKMPAYPDTKSAIITTMKTQLDNDTRLLVSYEESTSTATSSGAGAEAIDIKKPKLSLAGKWMPREGSSETFVAFEFAKVLFPEVTTKGAQMKAYRQLITRLNKALQTLEVAMCGHTWETIDPKGVPGRALKLYARALNNQPSTYAKYVHRALATAEERFPTDEDRKTCAAHFKAHLGKVATGEASVHGADVVFPHEIVNLLMNHLDDDLVLSPEQIATYEGQWADIVRKTKTANGLKKCVPVADVSGSMQGLPMTVSIALSILTYEVTDFPFIITFHDTPAIIKLDDCPTLLDKVRRVKKSPWGGSTNFQATMDLVLGKCVEAHLPASEIPKWILVFTDMGFDSANGYSRYVPSRTSGETHIEMIHRSWIAHGYTPPTIVVWNLRGEYKDFHAKADTDGVLMLSGWSPAILKMLQNEGIVLGTPMDGLRAILDDARYDPVRTRLREFWASFGVETF